MKKNVHLLIFQNNLSCLVKFQPFVSNDLQAYLERYWAVVFTVGSRPLETTQMRQYLSWYCTRGKVIELDHHIYAHSIRQEIIETTGKTDLPVMFVRGKCVGTLPEVQNLEKKRLLKDILQFGFQWKTGGGGGEIQTNHSLPSHFHDKDLYRARYRGAPVAKPVVQLPSFSPLYKYRDE